MKNDRPLQDLHTQEALNKLLTIYREYDLAGGCYVVSAHEMGFGYALYTTWNAIMEDETLPLGFRIRAKASELGHARARALLEGTARCFGAMQNFGTQCTQWGTDLMRLLRQAGVRIEHTPFGGETLPHLGGLDMRKKP